MFRGGGTENKSAVRLFFSNILFVFVFQIYSILQFQSYLHDLRVSIPGLVCLAHAGLGGGIQSPEEGLPLCVVTGQPLRFLCLLC